MEHLSLDGASNISTLRKDIIVPKEEGRKKGLRKLLRSSTIKMERRIYLNIQWLRKRSSGVEIVKFCLQTENYTPHLFYVKDQYSLSEN